jgi:hypothetical protein
MPKKSRRSKAKHRAAVAKAGQQAHSQQSKPLRSEARPAPRPSPKTQDLGSRYQYVVPEVKRIGMIAGSIIVVLIVLSFILA